MSNQRSNRASHNDKARHIRKVAAEVFAREGIARASLNEVANLPPADQLRVILREFLLAYEGMDHEHKIQTEGLPLLPADQQKVLKGHQRRLVTVISDTLAARAPLTLGQDKAKRRDATMSVFGMLNWFYMWHPQADKAARDAYASSIADLTLNGILPRDGGV